MPANVMRGGGCHVSDAAVITIFDVLKIKPFIQYKTVTINRQTIETKIDVPYDIVTSLIVYQFE